MGREDCLSLGIIESKALREPVAPADEDLARLQEAAAKIEQQLDETEASTRRHEVRRIPPRDLTRRSQRVHADRWHPGFGRR